MTKNTSKLAFYEMNEFGIVYLLPYEAMLYHERLSYDIEAKFRLKGTFKLNAPSHITLKYRFQTEDIESVKQSLEAFCAEQIATPWRIEGFNFSRMGRNMSSF